MLNTRVNHLIAAGLAPAVVMVASLSGCTESTVTDGGTYEMDIAGKHFKLQVSSSDATRSKGLGGVTTIADDGGMIFIFPDSKVRSFWMIDCVSDMDVVFLDGLGYVTAMYSMSKEPPKQPDETQAQYENRLRRYSSLAPAQYAIELRKGRAEELGIKTRQKIPLDAPTLKAAAK